MQALLVLLIAGAIITAQTSALAATPADSIHTTKDSVYVVTGRIADPDGNGLVAANVFLVETLEGALAGADGAFALRTRRSGAGTLAVQLFGYKPRRLAIQIPSTQPLTIQLEVSPIQLPTVVVRPSSFVAGDEPDVSLTSLEVVRTPGAAADVFRAIQTFPGVQAVDEGAGLFVRGGDVSETRVLLNEATVISPYRNETAAGVTFGLFDPFLLDGIFFSSGGFGARYGDALSGIAALRTMGRPRQREVGLTLGLAALSGRVGFPLANGFGARATATRSNTSLLYDVNGTTRDFTHDPEGRDLSASATWNHQGGGQIKAFGLSQNSRLGVVVEDPSYTGAFEAQSANDLATVSWLDSFGHVRPSVTLAVARSTREQGFGAFELSTSERLHQLRSLAECDLTSRWTATGGFEVEERRSQFVGTVPDHGYDARPGARRTVVNSIVRGVRSAAFGEVDWKPLAALRITGGVRADRSTLTDRTSIDPRIAGAVRLADDLVLTAAWGIYHQVPSPLLFEPSTGREDLGPMRGMHEILGLEYEHAGLMARLEAYHKSYGDLAQRTRDRDVAAGGRGATKGIDAFLRWRGSPLLDARAAYSFVDARRTDPNTGYLTRSPFDITHTASILLERPWTRSWRTSLAVRYATGRPLTSVIGAAFDSTQQVWVPAYGSPNGERLPAFYRLDLSTSYMWSWWPGNRTIGFAGVTNALDRDNLYGYRYSSDYSERIPVRSQIKRSVYAGLSFNF